MPTYEIEQRTVFPNGGDTIDIADDAAVIGSEWRGPHRLIVAVLSPTDSGADEADDEHVCACGESFDTERGLAVHRTNWCNE